MTPESTRERGFVLINALVIVAALAAMALLLLTRAEAGRSRQAAAQQAVQLRLALDGFEALARQRLQADMRADQGVSDHPDEAWARPVLDQPLGPDGRLLVSGRIEDLQGRFNVNWLSNPEDLRAQQGFLLLAQSRGLSQQEAAALAQRITGAGLTERRGNRDHQPRPGPLGLVLQLRQVPGVDAADLQRLEPFLAALPGDTGLNLNTAHPEVLTALFPEAKQALIQQIVQRRRQQPFADIEAFLQQYGPGLEPALADLGPEDNPDTILPPQLLSTRSDWFEARIAARIAAPPGAEAAQQAERVTILQRQPLPEPVAVAYRVEQPR